MSQFDFGTIDPYVVDGVELADDLNKWRDAIHSWHRGSTRPSYAVPGMAWINDVGGPTDWQVMIYLGPTVGDVPWFSYDTTTGKMAAPTTVQLGPGGPKLVAVDAHTLAANDDGGALVPINVVTRAPGDAGDASASTKFVHDAIATAMASGSSIYVGPTAPASPNPNMLWWCSDNTVAGGARLYIYYNDGNSTQWVPASPPLGVVFVSAPTYDASSTGYASGANFWAGGDNPMQIANGVQIFSRVFTAANAAHAIEVDVLIYTQAPNTTAAHGIVGLFIDGAAAAVAQGYATAAAGSASMVRLYWQGVLAAGPHTFQVRLGSLNTSGIYTNMSDAGHVGGGAQKNTMVIREVVAGASPS